jgi:hypothetical protein
MNDFTRILNPGTELINGQKEQVFVKIEYKNKRLSLTGVVGPRSNGNCRGSCGQIMLDEVTPNDDWTYEKINELQDIWNKWHLNDLRAGCEHQRKNWDTNKSITITTYGKQQIKTAGWVTPSEHPDGLLTKTCEICGYKYGTQWLFEEIPEEILQTLMNYPGAKIKPAWV